MVNPRHSLFLVKMVRIDPETCFSSMSSSKDLISKLSGFSKGFKESSSVLKFGAFHCYIYVHVYCVCVIIYLL